jgi:hypothetical protein
MELMLDDKDMTAGERFYLHMYLHNPTSEPYDADAYVLLGVYGAYWSWPSWSEISVNLDHDQYSCNANESHHESLLDFTWPEVGGSADGLEFIGCLFEPGTWNIIGEVNYFTWGYR